MKILVTAEAYDLVMARAVHPWEDMAKTEFTDEGVLVEISDETLERVNKYMLNGETFSDTIVRCLSPKQ